MCKKGGVDKTWTPLLDPLMGPLLDPFLDPLLDPSIFSVKKKIRRNYKVIHNTCATYLQPPLLSHLSFLRFSVQLERTCSPSRNAFPSSRLVFPRGIRNLLAISYSDNFRKTCRFQVARTPAILFSAILVFPLTSTNEGRCSSLQPLCSTRDGRDDGG